MEQGYTVSFDAPKNAHVQLVEEFAHLASQKQAGDAREVRDLPLSLQHYAEPRHRRPRPRKYIAVEGGVFAREEVGEVGGTGVGIGVEHRRTHVEVRVLDIGVVPRTAKSEHCGGLVQKPDTQSVNRLKTSQGVNATQNAVQFHGLATSTSTRALRLFIFLSG